MSNCYLLWNTSVSWDRKLRRGTMPLRKGSASRGCSSPLSFFLPHPLQAIINPLPLASVQRDSLNEIIHHQISWLFFFLPSIYSSTTRNTLQVETKQFALTGYSQANIPYICTDGSMLPLASPALPTHKIRRKRWSRGTLGRWQVPDQHVGPLQR